MSALKGIVLDQIYFWVLKKVVLFFEMGGVVLKVSSRMRKKARALVKAPGFLDEVCCGVPTR